MKRVYFLLHFRSALENWRLPGQTRCHAPWCELFSPHKGRGKGPARKECQPDVVILFFLAWTPPGSSFCRNAKCIKSGGASDP